MYYFVIMVSLIPLIKFTLIKFTLIKFNFNPFSFFFKTIIVLYIIIIYYLVLKDLFKAIYSTQTSINDFFINLVIFYLTLFFFKKLPHDSNLNISFAVYLILFYWFFLIELLLLDFVLLLIFCKFILTDVNVTKQFLPKSNKIHLLMLILVFFVKKHTYIFDSIETNYLEFIGNYFKLNNYYIFSSSSFDLINQINTVKVFVPINEVNIFEGFFKNIFEKLNLLNCNAIVELYTYNLQQLYQIIGFTSIFLLLVVLLLL